MTSKLNILHTEWSDGMGGQEKRVLFECRGLQDRGHSITLVCREHGKIKEKASEQGIEVITLPFRTPYDIESIIKLTKILKKKRIHIINTHSGIDSWIGAISGKLAGVKAIVRTRHLDLPLRRNIINFVHYLPDLFITCGENIRKNLIEKFGFPSRRVISIPTGIEERFFSVERNKKLKERFGLKENQPVIINVGIFRSMKNHELTLDAFHKVLTKFPNSKLFLVGDGPRRDFLVNYVKQLNIEDSVIFAGFQADVSPFYSIGEVFVLSSKSAEGVPQALLQAMAVGVPVVATAVGGVPEVVIHEKTGLLSKPGDADELASNILKILNNPDFASFLAANAKIEIQENHTLTVMLDKIEHAYLELMQK